uniref:YjbE family putative metal transport protein n=1 Tax=Candidatus Pelagibacter sp. TaxID=2024849 RepID=UPI00404B3217
MLEDSIILIQIIFIDVVMAADNAIIIGMIAANFATKNRNQIILWGLFGALVFRIIFAFFASYLFGFAYVKIIGGLLLIWIVNDLRRDLFDTKQIKSPTSAAKEPSYIQSVYKVLFADITLSFDNVIGIVGVAKNNINLLIFGLFLSVVLVGTLAKYFAEVIRKYKWFGYIGLITIIIVALQLIISGLNDLDILSINESFKRFF